MKKTVLRYGLLSSLIIVVLFTLSFLFLGSSDDYGAREVVGYSSMVIALLFVFFGIKHYRDRENGGQLSFGKGMKVGLMIVLIPALAFGLFNVLYVEVLNPNFMDEYYQAQMNQLQQTMTPENFEAAKARMQSEKEFFSNTFVSSSVMFLTVFIIGVIVTVISSLILRKGAGHREVRSAVA